VKRLLFISGRPGIGKTTVLLNIADKLKEMGFTVGGMISREARQEGTRVGFEIVDFAAGSRGWLARVNQSTGPKVGKYRVNIQDLDAIGVKAIQTALRESSTVVVDEIGPMELFSEAFVQVIKDALDGNKLILGVIRHSARHPLIETIKRSNDAYIETVTIENRSSLHNVLIRNALQYLQKESQ